MSKLISSMVNGVLLSPIISYSDIHVRFLLLPALTQDGIIYSDIKLGAYDGPSFLVFLKGLLKYMNPYPAPRSVLVLDNCAIHHVEGCKSYVKSSKLSIMSKSSISDPDDSRVKIMYLPPYSPDLNPIEESFSFVKAFL